MVVLVHDFYVSNGSNGMGLRVPRANKVLLPLGLTLVCLLAIAFAVGVPYGAIGVAKAFSITIFVLTPVCFWLALKNSPITPREALLEIVPLWISAAVAIAGGLSMKTKLNSPLVPSFVFESLSVLLTFAFTAAVLTHRRPQYRRMFSDVRRLAFAT